MLEQDQIIKLSDLPDTVKEQIPFSLRTYRDEYKFSELPYEIQSIIEHYLKRSAEVTYNTLFDVRPEISAYGDFDTIDNIYDLVVEYIRVYLMLQPNDYPFDPGFGSQLKRYVQKLDTETQYLLISNEIDQIAKVVSLGLLCLVNLPKGLF